MFKRRYEQHIAVLGESGSGKTTLLSVFYGHQQSASFSKAAGYSFLARDTSQGNKLLQAYHRIEDELLPLQTRYHPAEFDFSVRPHGLSRDAAKIVWRDYPGEWWTETKKGEEGSRKAETFNALISSDTALILVDGQRLLQDRDRYVCRLFKALRDELGRHRDEAPSDARTTRKFPRIWTICLSKADLFPGVDAEWFRNKVILKSAADEVHALREEIGCHVSQPGRISLGDDYLLLSSAKFDPETGKVIDPSASIGVDLIVPLAVTALLRRDVAWAEREGILRKTGQSLADAARHLTTKWLKWIPVIGRTFQLLDDAAQGGIEKLEEFAQAARDRGDAIDAVLAAFEIRLRQYEDRRLYIRSWS